MKRSQTRAVRVVLFLIVTLSCLALDLATKHWAFSSFGLPGEKPPYWVISKVLAWQTSLNQGALFGIGQGQIPLFVALSCVAAIGIFAWVWYDTQRSVFLACTLGLVGGGALGNLWDRLGLHGMVWTQFDVDVWSCPQEMVGQPVYAVRDWILVMLGSYPWPNFNIADTCLVCGAILIGLYAFFGPTPAKALENQIAQTLENSAVKDDTATQSK
ncbi:MAG: signal peptidase II [Planctomycetia bacterium]|nr:signal peptidase II [Planctomycetia bacterium]